MPYQAALIVFASLLLLTILLAFVTLNRYFTYKERVALARLGYSVADLAGTGEPSRSGSRGVLWGGVITMMSGFALLLGLTPLGTGVWLIAGLLPMFVGLGMLLIYFTSAGSNRQRHHAQAVADVPAADDVPGEDAVSGQDNG
ncbi:MAG: hypothetical protein ACOX2L_06470 [Anaerolineae bacterium]|jgi:hypothetical protein|nr:hypothetical protein [Chloroflexota bacterium]